MPAFIHGSWVRRNAISRFLSESRVKGKKYCNPGSFCQNMFTYCWLDLISVFSVAALQENAIQIAKLLSKHRPQFGRINEELYNKPVNIFSCVVFFQFLDLCDNFLKFSFKLGMYHFGTARYVRDASRCVESVVSCDSQVAVLLCPRHLSRLQIGWCHVLGILWSRRCSSRAQAAAAAKLSGSTTPKALVLDRRWNAGWNCETMWNRWWILQSFMSWCIILLYIETDTIYMILSQSYHIVVKMLWCPLVFVYLLSPGCIISFTTGSDLRAT